MEDNTKKQRSKAIKMIFFGFAGPLVLLIALLIITSVLNYITRIQGGYTGSLDDFRNILNVILLLVGIIAVSGFVWGPILGIFGIVKLSKLSSSTTEFAGSSESSQNSSQATVGSQDNNNQTGGNDVT